MEQDIHHIIILLYFIIGCLIGIAIQERNEKVTLWNSKLC